MRTAEARTSLRRSLAAAAFLAGLLALGVVSLLQSRGRNGLPPGGDFTLQSARGPVALHDLRGQVVLVFFGFINCAVVCPAALTLEANALRRLRPEEQARVAGLMVSLDPDRDALPELGIYGHAFHPNILGVTGPETELQDIARRYGVLYSRQTAEDSGQYSVDHSADIFVVGTDGSLRARMPMGTSSEALVAEIRLALR